MTVVDLIKSFIDSSKERLKTPISGAFICSFTIYNWRPIAVLFFSKASIEDKIVKINNYYCNPSAIIIPILIALIYTVGVPFIMMKIDQILVYAKKERLKRIYKSKEDVVDFKIDLAARILDLKNAESGNKEKQDFLDQIEALKESNRQIIETNKNAVDQVNVKLKEANEDLRIYIDKEINSKKLGNIQAKSHKNTQNDFGDYVSEVFDGLSKDDLNQFIKLRRLTNGVIEDESIRSIKEEYINRFTLFDFIFPVNNNYSFTNKGEALYNLLRVSK